MAKPKIDRLIIEIYRQRPDIVDDDAKLLTAVWYRCGWDPTATLYDNLKRMPHADTITRARRKLHERGIIVYSEPVDLKRFARFKACRAEYAHA